MDLINFQFDFDLSFAVFFVDADLTIYDRFGTRSDRPEEQDLSLEGLRKAMAEALRMHRDAAAVKPSLAGKQAKPSRFQTPRDHGPDRRVRGHQGRTRLRGERRAELHPLPPDS